MVSVKKDFRDTPTRFITENSKTKVANCIANPKDHKYYGYNTDEIVNRLYIIYNRKCGYCETKENAGFKLQVEHYRPKAEVKEDENHPGYYWLGYEWSNLLLACPKCNQQGAKGNYFPINGDRVNDHTSFLTNGKLDKTKCHAGESPLIDEEPLFLNPELDDVEKHLIFLPNGKIVGTTDRGKTTIQICNLNDEEKRNPLIIARKKIVDDVVIEITSVLADFADELIEEETLNYNLNKIFNYIYLRDKKQIEYSRVFYFMFIKFEIFILNQFKPKSRELLEDKFKLFKEGILLKKPE